MMPVEEDFRLVFFRPFLLALFLLPPCLLVFREDAAFFLATFFVAVFLVAPFLVAGRRVLLFFAIAVLSKTGLKPALC